MRQEKEEMVMEPTDIKVNAHEYQNMVEIGCRSLNELERRALYLRFWQPHTIVEIADLMALTWEATDALIDHALSKVHEAIRRELRSRQRGRAA